MVNDGVPVPDLVNDGVPVPDLVNDGVPVPDRVWVDVPVNDRVAALVCDPVAAPVGVGVTGTHAPHVSPENPGAPGVDDTAICPTSQVPAQATAQDVYPTGQGAQTEGVPATYCPGGQSGVGPGVRLREPVWVRDLDAATASSRCATRWEGVFDGDSVGLADRVGVGVTAPDRVEVCVANDDRVEVCVATDDRVVVRVTGGDCVGERDGVPDLVEVLVDFGDVVGDTGMHAPQVDGMYPAAQEPENTGAQAAYPGGQERVGVGVGSAVPDTDAVLVDAGLPDTDDVRLDDDIEVAGLPDTEEVKLDAGVHDTDDVTVKAGELDTDEETVDAELPDKDADTLDAGLPDTDDEAVAADEPDTDDDTVDAGLPDTDEVTLAAGLPDTDAVLDAAGDLDAATDALGETLPHGVTVGDTAAACPTTSAALGRTSILAPLSTHVNLHSSCWVGPPVGTTPLNVPAASAQQLGAAALHTPAGLRDSTNPAASESADAMVHPVMPSTTVSVANKLAAEGGSVAPPATTEVPGMPTPTAPAAVRYKYEPFVVDERRENVLFPARTVHAREGTSVHDDCRLIGLRLVQPATPPQSLMAPVVGVRTYAVVADPPATAQ